MLLSKRRVLFRKHRVLVFTKPPPSSGGCLTSLWGTSHKPLLVRDTRADLFLCFVNLGDTLAAALRST